MVFCSFPLPASSLRFASPPEVSLEPLYPGHLSRRYLREESAHQGASYRLSVHHKMPILTLGRHQLR